MPKNIRLSGKILDNDSPRLRKVRAKLLYHLFLNNWNIYNGNGDQDVSLWNIQKKIVEADGFVFMPGAALDDLVKASSIFVGYQTGDMDLNNKPTVVLNSEGTWTKWLKLIRHLHEMGTVSQNFDQVFSVVKKAEEVPEALKKMAVKVEEVRTKYEHKPKSSKPSDKSIKEPEKKVCVFCSASTKNEEHLKIGYQIGREIAKKGFGCVTGAGRTGIMGEVVRGVYENKGWSGGSNVPHIIEMEGLPDGLNEFWPRGDIYTRMEVMIEKSSAFIILPGGMGSVQEALVLLQLKHKNDPLMKNKPIYIVNVPSVDINGKKKDFWTPLLELAADHNVADMLVEVKTPDDLLDKITKDI